MSLDKPHHGWEGISNGGEIYGDTYGIRLNHANQTLNIGKSSEELSDSTPFVSGGMYAIYRENGQANFYNGRIRGITYGYNTDFSNVRREHDIISYTEHMDDTDPIRTFAVSEATDEPVAKKAKKGNGAARITYLGETEGTCIHNDYYDSTYMGDEDTFIVPCTGKYSLEVWGAQGGTHDTSIYGGYGGYTYGEIELTTGDTLYINVGGQGTAGYNNGEVLGGYNGGGNAYSYVGGGYKVGSGGGATHISTKPGLLSELENSKSDILIVAGGGGGSFSNAWNSYGPGGSGGGYIGHNTVSNRADYIDYRIPAKGGTQSEGGTYGAYYSGTNVYGVDDRSNGSFGTGGSYTRADNNVIVCAGGAGYYGGGATYYGSGAGGSGYFNFSKITNGEMYGYDVPHTINDYINNILVEKEAFLETQDGEPFKSIDSAIAYLDEFYEGKGTITLLKTVNVSESTTIPAGDEIVFNLAGFEYNTTQPILNLGKFTLQDGSSSHTGLLYNSRGNSINNKGTLIIDDNVHIKSSSSAIYTSEIANSITIGDGCLLEGTRGIYTDIKTTITIGASSLKGTEDGIFLNSGSGHVITLNNTEVNKNFHGRYGIRKYYNASSITYNLNGGYIYGYDYAINIEGSSTGIIKGTEIEGDNYYGLYVSSSTVTISDDAYLHFNNKYSNGNDYTALTMTTDATVTLNDATIESERIAIYQVYNSTNLTVNDGASISGKVYGLMVDYEYYSNNAILTINGGNISSDNIGLFLNGRGKTYFNAGTISGGQYGIHVNHGNQTLNIGEKDKPLSTTAPYVSGGEYGIYRSSGTVNYYNGRLRGTESGHNTDFSTLRVGYDIKSIDEYEDPEDLTSQKYVVNYLEEMIPFIRVQDGREFNVFNDAIAYIQENYSGVGTLTLTRDITYQQEMSVPEGTDISINFANHKFNTTQTLVNSGKLTISDVSTDKNGILYNSRGDTINNKGTLIINDNVDLKSSNNVIKTETNTSTVTIGDGCTLVGSKGIYVDVKTTLTVGASSIQGTSDGILLNSGSGHSITLTNTEINKNFHGQYGIRKYYNASSITYDITGGYIYGYDYAMNIEGSSTATIKGTEIIGDNYYSIYIASSTVTISDDAKIHFNNSYSNGDNYAALSIYSTSTVTLSDCEITSKRIAVYLEYTNCTLNINEGTLIDGKEYGLDTLGDYYGYSSIVNMNGGRIQSNNIGAYLRGKGTMNFNSGEIFGNIYGLRIDSSYYILNVGDATKTVNIDVPFIEGSLYGIYRDNGTMNFNNGRLIGNTGPYYGEFTNVRENYQIYLDTNTQSMDSQKLRTYSTTEHSDVPTANTPLYGNGYAKLSYSLDDMVKNYEFTNPEAYTFVTPGGYYKLEVWGAQGGGKQTHNISELGVGGKGGYAKGIVHLDPNDTLYINVGEEGHGAETGIAIGGYNGGGATWASSSGDPAGGGGGATDIRINQNDLHSRVIVAGGGGGGGEDNETGGFGGGTSGGGGYPGTQTSTSGGGVFGQGAHTPYDGGGAGGGWYGAGSAGGSQTLPTGNNGNDNNGGSGGSGYIFTSTSDIVEGYLLDNKYQLTEATLLGGDKNIPAWDEDGSVDPGIYDDNTVVGNSGNGHARITYLGDALNGITLTLSTTVGTLPQSTYTYTTGSKLGTLSAPNLPDGYVFDGWYLDQEFTEKVDYNTTIYTDATIYAKVVSNSAYCASNIRKVYEFNYKGGEEEFLVPCSGEYKIEVWGGSSGPARGNSQPSYGGYSVGKIMLTNNEKLYVNVGGQGKTKYNSSGTIPGGYNGGGQAFSKNGYNYNKSSSGGATHIATKSGLLSTLSNDRDKILIVAGGGGGYIQHNNDYTDYGGSGGGYIGGTGTSYYGVGYAGTGGTQEKGGYSSNWGETSRGTFGKGGEITYDYFYVNGAGGYYGGGASYDYHAAAGGGSGYIGNDRLYDKSMYGYNVTAKNDTEYSTVAYLITADPYIWNKTQNIEYTDLNLAVNNAHENDEFELIANGNNTVSVEIPEISFSIDMKGFNLNSTKTIVNKGDITITNSVSNKDPKIFTNLTINLINNKGTLSVTGVDLSGYNTIINSGTLNLTNSRVTTTNQGIRNSSKINLINTTVTGGKYALYDESSENNTLTSITLNSSTAIQKEGTGRLTLTTPSLTGTINNTKSNSMMIITGGTFNGAASNYGTLNMGGMTTTYYRNDCSSYNQISNYGTMTFNNNTVSSTYNYSCQPVTSIIYNTNTLTTSSNTYTIKSDSYYDDANYHYRYANQRGIINEGILTSTGEIYNFNRNNSSISIYNNSTNETIVNNITVTDTNTDTAYGVYNKQGTLKVTGATINHHDNITNTYGIYTEDGNVIAKNYNVTASNNPNSYGIKVDTGTTTLETGNIQVSGTNSYGIYVNTGTATLGVEGSGVVTDNPYVEAIGTTKGYGVYMGDGNFNYYDGKILGSTNYRNEGKIFTNIEDEYKIQEIDEANGKACILVSIY